MTFCEMFWTFAFVLIFCELGEMVSSQFVAFNGSLERCNWYLFPIDMQQLMITAITNAQQPIEIGAFGNIVCTRETFKKVINCCKIVEIKLNNDTFDYGTKWSLVR